VKSILDSDFKYTPSFDTDIRKKFDEARDKTKAELERANRVAEEAERVLAKTRIKGKA
jgi:hypothetical protein